MSADHSITECIEKLREGDAAAAQALWERYYKKLVDLARQKLQGTRKRVADEEDIAQNAFFAFCDGARRGRFPNLADRHDLWRLLLRVTARRAVDLARYEGRRPLEGESALGEEGIAQIAGDELTPEFAAEVSEEFRRLLESLPDNDLQEIAIRKMDGYTNTEIAQQLGCSQRTIERRLQLIRRTWS